MNPNLLNKIQSIKTLRDRAATEGEKDAAQNRLTLILAKHKLTEQDIPDQSFSTRGRPSPRTPPDFSGFDFSAFEDILSEFRRAAEAATGYGSSQSRPRSTPDDTEWEPSRGRRTRDDMRTPTGKGKKTARERFEKVLKSRVSDPSWNIVRKAHKKASRLDAPSNKAAYARAFYESAAYRIRERAQSSGPFHSYIKSKNAAGIAAGSRWADDVSLTYFPLNDF